MKKARRTRPPARHANFAAERRAVQIDLDLLEKEFNDLAGLARAANRSVDRSLKHLDEAIVSVRGVLHRRIKRIATG